MSDKKHIDRIFQEGFKDFEVQPSDAVWKNIESQLNDKKKKRRVIPIWWRYAGVAALLLLFISLSGIFFNPENNTATPIVNTESNSETTIDKLENTPLNNTEKIASEDDHSEEVDTHDALNATPTEYENIVPSKATSVTHANSTNPTTKPSIASTNAPNTAIAHSNNNTSVDPISEEESINKVAPNNKANSSAIASVNDKTDYNTPSILEEEKPKNNISNSSEENSTEIAENDKTTITIEEALEKNKDILKDEIENQENKWSVAPNAAPVYFNTLGEGSPIDPQFSNNSKTGEVNMSYGVSASYAINNKIKIRSGVNKVNLGYNTNDIVVYQSVGLSTNSNALQNVNSKASGASAFSVVSSESLAREDLPQTLLTSNTTLNQAFGYIEVPLEVQYTLSDKKLGVNVIGGFSSFFLDNNEVYSRAENGPMVFLGEANNINKVSYSANFGLGLNYQASKTFDLNLEPMFKYQFNTFKNSSGNFTPYFIGVYTGFAIKF